MNEITPQTRTSFRNKALLGTAIALVLGGVIAGEATLMPSNSARAEAVTVAEVQAPSFADLAEKVSPAVVSVRVKSDAQVSSDDGSDEDGMPNFNFPPGSPLDRFFREFRGPNGPGGQGGQGGPGQMRPRAPHERTVGLGSGFFVSEDGYLVTNNHVVDQASDFTVIMNDGTELSAKLIGKDDKTDLALLKVNSDRKFTYVKFSEDKVRVGEWVLAVGNPFGLGGTVTSGIVSAQGRNIGAGPYDDYIQIDAAVNRGNSGGPTFNLKGEVIGVNTAIYSPSGGNVGIAFAVPASTAEDIVNTLKEHGSIVRGWLGVQIQPVTDEIASSLRLSESKGALVAAPQDDSPATKAGIKAGDTIVAVDGKPVENPTALAKLIAHYSPDTTVTVTLWRDGAKQDVSVKLGTMPGTQKEAKAEPAPAATPTALKDFGIDLGPSQDGQGVVITNIDPDGKAADSGLQTGDVILAVGNTTVTKPDDVQKAVDTARKDGLKAVLFRVKSGDDTPRYVALNFAQA